MPRSHSSSNPGRLIAERYRLESKLGEGAMGVVWSASDELLRRAVAIKEVRLPPQMPEDEAAEVRERALREARAIAVVTHPNVVTLYDVAREEGESFVVMELVPSQSLAAVLNEHGPLHDVQLALVADGVASALEAAHRTGIIHRDVKPGNVLIGDDGRIKLSDFGISRNAAEPTITRTGIMLGTPAYIAPEIASGDPVTAAADLWGLGATLFAAAEGIPPYGVDDNPLSTITSVVRDPVPVPARTGTMGEIIAGLMVKDPSRRMPAQEVRRRVQSLLPEPGVRPFEMLIDPEAPTVRVRRPAEVARTRNTAPSESGPPQLASDPGPLPFMPQEPMPPLPKRRGSMVALGIAALVVFVSAMVSAYVGVQILSGQSASLPGLSTTSTRQSSPTFTRTENAAHTSAEEGGKFQVAVPANWTKFQEEQDDITNSMAVSYVSRDGKTSLTVQRYGGFFDDGYTSQDYLNELHRLEGDIDGELRAGPAKVLSASDGASGEPTVQLTYSTSENGIVASSPHWLVRRTIERLIPEGGDLWLVRLTVPEQRSAGAEALFERLVPSFRVLS